ncbi:MAG TPA: glycosyltransferase [Pyrinomonadaceae bacterium]|nr:glycosyltransferase [Pyrinomonadaceae bacterium]
MRVLHVIPSVAERSGGPAIAIVPMCRALKQEGIEVLLVSTSAGVDHDESLYEYKGIPAKFFPTQLGDSFKYSRPLSSWLSANIEQFDVAHIHAVFNHSSIAAAHVCRKARVPYVVRPLGTLEPWSMTQKSLRKRVFWQVSGKGMLRRAAAVHYTTDAEKLSTERLLGLNHGKVIALGIETTASASHAKLEQHFPELASEPYMLVLSRLHPKKGLDVLIDAFLALVQVEKFAHWRLVIAGDGPEAYVLKLKAMAGSSAQRDRIVFTGWLDGEEKDAVLGGASLLVLPSHQENFGLCVMEALSHSVPVLVSPHVNLAEEIVLANAGWIATVDKDALISRLAEALGDEEERVRRGLAGKQLSQKYSWDTAAKSLIDLYKQVVTLH